MLQMTNKSSDLKLCTSKSFLVIVHWEIIFKFTFQQFLAQSKNLKSHKQNNKLKSYVRKRKMLSSIKQCKSNQTVKININRDENFI